MQYLFLLMQYYMLCNRSSWSPVIIIRVYILATGYIFFALLIVYPFFGTKTLIISSTNCRNAGTVYSRLFPGVASFHSFSFPSCQLCMSFTLFFVDNISLYNDLHINQARSFDTRIETTCSMTSTHNLLN